MQTLKFLLAPLLIFLRIYTYKRLYYTFRFPINTKYHHSQNHSNIFYTFKILSLCLAKRTPPSKTINHPLFVKITKDHRKGKFHGCHSMFEFLVQQKRNYKGCNKHTETKYKFCFSSETSACKRPGTKPRVEEKQ